MLVKCPGCGKEISKNARICPHCKRDTAALQQPEMRPCRACKTPLRVKDHLSTVYTSTPWIVDRSPVTASVKYTPCPQCGEPRPILPGPIISPARLWAKRLVLPILIAAAVAAYLILRG